MPFVIKTGPHKGLYVIRGGKLVHVPGETRPYAPPFKDLLYDPVNEKVFYWNANVAPVHPKAFVTASQAKQDEYARKADANQMGVPYCNGVVSAIRKGLICAVIISDKHMIQWVLRASAAARRVQNQKRSEKDYATPKTLLRVTDSKMWLQQSRSELLDDPLAHFLNNQIFGLDEFWTFAPRKTTSSI
jgi:hypothetical protein